MCFYRNYQCPKLSRTVSNMVSSMGERGLALQPVFWLVWMLPRVLSSK